MSEPIAPSPVPAPDPAPKKSRLGLIALIVAIVGTIFAVWEGAYIIGWILLPIAFILSIVALVQRGTAKKLAVAALILSIVGTVCGGIAFAMSVGRIVDEAFGDLEMSAPAAGTVTNQSGEVVQTESGASSTEANSAAAEGEFTFVDGVLQGKGVKFEITGHQVIAAGAEGNEYGDKPLLVIEYTTTNEGATSEVTPDLFLFAFDAYQDNDPNAVNELEIGYASNLYDKYGDTGHQAIKQGGSVPNAVAYKLDDTTTPVDLVASTIVGKEIGRMTIPLQ